MIIIKKEITIRSWEDFRNHIENLKSHGVPMYVEDINNEELNNPYRVGNKIPNPKIFENLIWKIQGYSTVSKKGNS